MSVKQKSERKIMKIYVLFKENVRSKRSAAIEDNAKFIANRFKISKQCGKFSSYFEHGMRQ